MCNTYVIIAWDQAPKWGKSGKNRPVKRARESGEGWGWRSSAPSPPPQSTARLGSFADFPSVSSHFLPFPITREPGPRLMLQWFSNKDRFKYKRLKDGRCSCKHTGSSHLNACFLVLVATLCRHTVNDPIKARGAYLNLRGSSGGV